MSNLHKITDITKKQALLLILLLLIALGLRYYKLGAHSYHSEEVVRITEASETVPKLFLGNIRNPFFRLLLHFWIKLFSKDEFTTRALSAILGALSIIPLYFLTRRLIDKKTALISTYLATISPFYTLLSRTTEDFTLSILLSSLSLFLFLYWCEEDRGLVLYIIVTILMLYAGSLPFFILIGEWIYFWLRWQTTKSKLKLWLIGQFFIVAAYSYWIVHFLQILPGESQAFDRLPAFHGAISKAFYAFYAFSLGETVLPWKWKIVLPASFIFAGSAAFGVTKLKRKYRSLSFVLIFLLLPLAPIFTNRGAPEYCIGASIAYYILLAIGIGAMRVPVSLTILGSIIFFNIYSLNNLYRDKEYHLQSFTDNWRLLAKYVEQESVAEEAQVVVYHPSFIWYYKGENLIVLNIGKPEPTETKLTAVNKVLFVHTLGSGTFSSNDEGIYKFKEWLDQNFLCTQSVEFFENEDYEIKRKLLKRSFPRFRVQVFIYERRNEI